MRPLLCLFFALVLAACGSRAVATSPTVTPTPTVESGSTPTASPTGGGSGSQDTVLGPAGMTLQQEIGAVMMVGFKGPLTPAVLEDWRQHQFGGLIVLPINQNAGDAAAIRQLIQSVRGVMRHPLMAATNSELATTSRMSSTIWKARPRSAPATLSARTCSDVAPQSTAPTRSEVRMRAPVLWTWM